MAVVLKLEPYAEALLVTGAMFGVVAVCTLLYALLRRGTSARRGGEGSEPYIGGEAPNILRRVDASAQNLYWGFVEGVSRTIYRVLRFVVHSGRLNEWAGYMAAYYGLLALLAIISLAIYIARLG